MATMRGLTALLAAVAAHAIGNSLYAHKHDASDPPPSANFSARPFKPLCTTLPPPPPQSAATSPKGATPIPTHGRPTPTHIGRAASVLVRVPSTLRGLNPTPPRRPVSLFLSRVQVGSILHHAATTLLHNHTQPRSCFVLTRTSPITSPPHPNYRLAPTRSSAAPPLPALLHLPSLLCCPPHALLLSLAACTPSLASLASLTSLASLAPPTTTPQTCHA